MSFQHFESRFELSFAALSTFALGSAFVGCTPACRQQEQGTPDAAIILTDADTGAPICNATVMISSGGYSQRLHLVELRADGLDAAPTQCLYGNPDSKPADGTYTVTIHAPGYPDASETLTLSSNECGDVYGGEKEVRLASSE